VIMNPQGLAHVANHVTSQQRDALVGVGVHEREHARLNQPETGADGRYRERRIEWRLAERAGAERQRCLFSVDDQSDDQREAVHRDVVPKDLERRESVPGRLRGHAIDCPYLLVKIV
jgi:hypothetical protein